MHSFWSLPDSPNSYLFCKEISPTILIGAGHPIDAARLRNLCDSDEGVLWRRRSTLKAPTLEASLSTPASGKWPDLMPNLSGVATPHGRANSSFAPQVPRFKQLRGLRFNLRNS